MKKKIISSILAVAMMASIAVPSVIAASSDLAGSYAKVTKITEKEGKDTWSIEVGKEFNIEDHINVYENETKLVLDKGQLRYELNGPTGEYNGFKINGSILTASQANRDAVLTIYDNYNKSTVNARVDIKLKSVEAVGGGRVESFTFKDAYNELPVTVTEANGTAEDRSIVVQSHPKGSVFSEQDLTHFNRYALPAIEAALFGTTATGSSNTIAGLFNNYSANSIASFEVNFDGAAIETKAVYTATLTVGTTAAGTFSLTNSKKNATTNAYEPFTTTSIDVTDASFDDVTEQAAEFVRQYNLETTRVYQASNVAGVITLTAIAAGPQTAPVWSATGMTDGTAIIAAHATLNAVTISSAVVASLNTTAQITNTAGALVNSNDIARAIVAANGASNKLNFGGINYVATVNPTKAGTVVFTADAPKLAVAGASIPTNGTMATLTLSGTGEANSTITKTSAFKPTTTIVNMGGTATPNASLAFDFANQGTAALAKGVTYTFGLGPVYVAPKTFDTTTDLAFDVAAYLGSTAAAIPNWDAAALGSVVTLTSNTGATVTLTDAQKNIVCSVTAPAQANRLLAVRQENNTEIKVTIPESILNAIYNNKNTSWTNIVGPRNEASNTSFLRTLDKSFTINVEMPRFDNRAPVFKASTNATYTEAIRAVSWQASQMNYEIEVGQTVKIPVTYYPPQANVGKNVEFEPASVLNNGKPFMYATIDGDNSVRAVVTDELKVIGVNSNDTAKTSFKGRIPGANYTAFITVAVKPTTYKPSGTPEFTSKISTTALEVEAGKIAPVTISNLPQGVTAKWTHKDDGTMGINKNDGPAVVVTGKKVGTNVLTASLSNGEKFDVAVTVKAATAVAPTPGTGNGGSTNVPQTGDSLFANLF